MERTILRQRWKEGTEKKKKGVAKSLDPTGIDPVTSSMRRKHATMCTKGPKIFVLQKYGHRISDRRWRFS